MLYLYIIPANGLKLSAIKPVFLLYRRRRFITKIINKRQRNSEVSFLPACLSLFSDRTIYESDKPSLDNGKSNTVLWATKVY